MPLTRSELEVPRTPKELKKFVDEIRAIVRSTRSEFELGMAKRGLYKEFLDEIEPLCNFADAFYPADYKVLPVLGNQGYDAVVMDLNGVEVDRLEFANPHDGEARAISSQQVVDRGYSDVLIRDHADPLGDLIPFIEATAKAKSKNDYGDITLVFFIAAPPSLSAVKVAFDKQVLAIRKIIASNEFKSRRVLLYVPPGEIIQVDQR